MVHADGPVGLDGVAVCFDDERAVADAGIVLIAALCRAAHRPQHAEQGKRGPPHAGSA
jgi:hypothetical protein